MHVAKPDYCKFHWALGPTNWHLLIRALCGDETLYVGGGRSSRKTGISTHPYLLLQEAAHGEEGTQTGRGGWGSSAEYLDQAPALIRGGTGEKDSNFLPLEKERLRRDGSGSPDIVDLPCVGYSHWPLSPALCPALGGPHGKSGCDFSSVKLVQSEE